jgi:rod shape-determining protein MreD
MNKGLLKYVLMFVVFFALQLLVLNNINLGGYINPFIYILFIILLPFNTPGWLLLILGFFTGLTMDSFSNTLGMHSSATLFLCFIRPYVISIISTSENTDKASSPNLSSNGLEWFIRYSLILIVAHHIVLFYLEAFTFAHFFLTLARVLISSATTFVFILLSQFFFFNK